MTDKMKVGSMTLDARDLQEAAANNANGVEAYTGAGDTSIEFGRANSFIDEGNSLREVIQKISNPSANDVIVALCPGYYGTAANIIGEGNVAADFIIADGTQTSGADATLKTLTVSQSPSKVVDLLGYAGKAPMRILRAKLKVDNVEQLEEPLYYRDNNPFGLQGEDRVFPSSTKDDSQSDEKTAVIPNMNWQFDGTHIITYKIKAGRSVTITWGIGATQNPTQELERKYRKAKQYVASATVKNM
jgi:hypothetical protein